MSPQRICCKPERSQHMISALKLDIYCNSFAVLSNLISRQTDRQTSVSPAEALWGSCAQSPASPWAKAEPQRWQPRGLAVLTPSRAAALLRFLPCTAAAIWSNSCSVSNSRGWARSFQQHQGETTSVAHKGDSVPGWPAVRVAARGLGRPKLCCQQNSALGGPLSKQVTSTTLEIIGFYSCQGE